MVDDNRNSSQGSPGQSGSPAHGKHGGTGGQGGTGGMGAEPSGTGGQGGPGGTGGTSSGTSNSHRVTTAVDWITRIVGTLSLVFLGVFYMAERDQAQCQAEFNVANLARNRNLDGVVAEERAANRRADDALAGVLTTLLTQPPAPAEARRRALEELQMTLSELREARIEADEARKKNPPIADPETAC
jgi:hypothetical protein